MKIFLSVRKIQILTFCWLFHISWFLMIMMDYLKWFYDWKNLDLKKLTKSQSFDFLNSWIFIRWFRFSLMINHDIWNVLNQEIRSRVFVDDFKINIQAIRSFIEQKVNDSPSSIKTLIGRFMIDLEKMLGIWRSNVYDWWRYIIWGVWRPKP